MLLEGGLGAMEVVAEYGVDDGVMDIASRAYRKKYGVVRREMERIGL